LRRLGVNIDDFLDDVLKKSEPIMRLMDKFNPTFASRGWILCKALVPDAADRALDAAAAGDWSRADEILAQSYTPALVRMFVYQMGQLRCFSKRRDLALLAVDDYEAERFHACVPVTLALLDGMGQELTGANFFRNTARIKPADSFLEIGPGVAQLIHLMSRSRKATSTEQLSVPFRHGIIHGTDLGYGNKIVAAKAWAALLAVGDYASDLLAPAPAPEKSLTESAREFVEGRKWLECTKAALSSWRPRSAELLAQITAKQDVGVGTPEEVVVRILEAWKPKRFGMIAKHSYEVLKTTESRLAGRIRDAFGPGPDRWHIGLVSDSTAAASEVTARLFWGDDVDEVTLRLVYYVGEECAPRNVPGGRWLVMSLWPLESSRSSALDDGEDDGRT
jgi:hypothetical protein